MADCSKFKSLTEEYGLDWVWDYSVNDGHGTGPGYLVLPSSEYWPPLGCLAGKTMEDMTDTELEDFVVQCAVLSMAGREDVWQV